MLNRDPQKSLGIFQRRELIRDIFRRNTERSENDAALWVRESYFKSKNRNEIEMCFTSV